MVRQLDLIFCIIQFQKKTPRKQVLSKLDSLLKDLEILHEKAAEYIGYQKKFKVKYLR